MKKIINKLMGWDNEYFPRKTHDEQIAELRRTTIYLEKRMDWLVKRVDKLEGR